jgi:hypothetical protein
MKNNQHEELQALVKAGKLEHVPVDLGFFAEQFESCSQIRIDVQALLENGSIQGAFVVGYTYIRKSATLLLYRRGVRPTARGGHRVIIDALVLDPEVSRELTKNFDEFRMKRNSIEYPDFVIQEVDLTSVYRCFEIGDQLLAIAQSISS